MKILILGVLLLLAVPGFAATQPSYATPEAAVAALVDAVAKGGARGVGRVLGADPHLLASGDAVADAAARKRFLDLYAERHMTEPAGPNRMVLMLGNAGWPLPMPLVRQGAAWRFDGRAGAEEIANRRIGRNELMTIRTLLATVAAQRDYFDRLARGTGTGAYAQKFLSSGDEHDGLYWTVPKGAAPSPLGPLLDQAVEEGYPDASETGKAVPYHGYLFRFLAGQGKHAPGGELSYGQGAVLRSGFALVAWPAKYGSSGVMSFLVNQDGVVFQKDLGASTAKTAGKMKLFDPDFTWARVDIAD